MIEKASFSVVDYILFILSLLVCFGIGLYYACCGKKQNTAKHLLLANRKLGIFPVSMSLLATFMSAISILGYPTEIYKYGTMFYWFAGMYCIGYPIAAYIFLPVFYNLELTSAYEYLERRFDRRVRLVASFTFIVEVVLYMTVVLYAPALALNSVTNLNMHLSIVATGLLATIYTSIGGAKAVVYTNMVQMILILIGLIAVAIAGSISVGGFGNVWQIATEGNRIYFTDFDADPRIRHSVWSLLVGGTFTLLTLFCANQMAIQRYISMRSLKSAQIAVILNLPLNVLVITLFAVIGLILYAVYHHCDPVSAGIIERTDQILPYFIMEKFQSILGLPGLFVSALYGASLSTLSGGFNAIAACLLEDFAKPIYSWRHQQTAMDDSKAAVTVKIIAFIIGLTTIGLAFIFDLLESTILQIALSIFGMVGGPLLGAFILGMFFPWANGTGALVGQIVSLIVTFWVGLHAYFMKITAYPLPMGTNCTVPSNISVSSYAAQFEDAVLLEHVGQVYSARGWQGGLTPLYSISYQYYSLLGTVTLVVVGMIVSFITGFTDPKTLNPDLLIPVYKKLCCCCPKKIKQLTKCGIDFDKGHSEPLRNETGLPLIDTDDDLCKMNGAEEMIEIHT